MQWFIAKHSPWLVNALSSPSGFVLTLPGGCKCNRSPSRGCRCNKSASVCNRNQRGWRRIGTSVDGKCNKSPSPGSQAPGSHQVLSGWRRYDGDPCIPTTCGSSYPVALAEMWAKAAMDNLM